MTFSFDISWPVLAAMVLFAVGLCWLVLRLTQRPQQRSRFDDFD